MLQATPGSARSHFSLQLQELMELLCINFVEPTRTFSVMNYIMATGAVGNYFPTHDCISVRPDMAPFLTLGDADSILLHEIVHWTGHSSRLHRDWFKIAVEGHSVPSLYETDQEEAIAQIGMHKLSKYLGMDMQKAELYLRNYLNKYPLADLERAEVEAEKALQYIVDLAYGEVRKAA